MSCARNILVASALWSSLSVSIPRSAHGFAPHSLPLPLNPAIQTQAGLFITALHTNNNSNSDIPPSSSSPSSKPSSYEERKKKSILEFCQEDPQDYPFQPDVWEGGKKDFATQLYEKEEKANDGAAGPILERHILKVLWIVELLRRENVEYCKLPSPTLLKHPTDALPSIVSNIKLIGTFKSDHWKEGFESPYEGFDYSLGEEYRAVDFDITVADGSVMKLNAVVNVGNADANTGCWGGVFVRDSTKMVAIIDDAGRDSETVIKEVPSNLGAFVPFSDSDLDFLTSYLENQAGREVEYKESMSRYEDAEGCETSDFHYDIFYDCWSPGICETQFEKIVGMVMDRFMETTCGSDWHPELKAQWSIKRSQSSYEYFSQEIEPIVLSENPKSPLWFISRLITERWNALSTEERKKYEDLAQEDMKRYKRELEEFDESRPSHLVERIWKVSGKNYDSL